MSSKPQPAIQSQCAEAKESSFLATRASLLQRVKNLDDAPGWEEFFNTYFGLIFATACKAGLKRAEAEDAVQDTFLALAKNIRSFRYDSKRCSFKSWLLLITRQRIIWQLRKRQPGLPAPDAFDDGTREARIDQLADPAQESLARIWEEEWKNHVLSAALDRVKRQVSARQFQIFDLHVLQNWPVSEVSRTLRVNIGQVYLAKHRVSALLKKSVRLVEEGEAS
jgi:RNA polymerase sigma factor (sigma-70 family)